MAGDTSCSDCGLVLESNYVDESSGRRKFAGSVLGLVNNITDRARKMYKNVEDSKSRKEKNLNDYPGTMHPGELVRLFCSKLGMHNPAIKAVQGALKQVEIAVAAEVAIKESYKDLAPYASRLIPQWYAEEVEQNVRKFAALEVVGQEIEYC
ncbi:hypothetical protein QQP08_013119 [Theobroma cacao]|uniref:TFIIB-type domain-containing protein n=1 Tax=Theobroma cacao TaxID=3641 RepID=A0A061EGA4_THECC|nr:Uncharacterized protein TCM_018743 [Theobroma cacao]WRX20632.1 hypothetical protein QQP08_013119 [Theobroma cacao]